MRLYLSSYQMGDRVADLLSMMGEGRRAAVIHNAVDYIDRAQRLEYERTHYNQADEFRKLGIASEELDLMQFSGQPEKLLEALKGLDLVWARGGNAFILRRAMKLSGFDRMISSMLEKNQIVYGGYSAGACVAGPTLRGIDLMDDPALVPAGYPAEIEWEGLGLIDFSIVPHFNSDHPESSTASIAAEFFQTNSMPYKALRDGEVIVT